jgi:hypothetical protein
MPSGQSKIFRDSTCLSVRPVGAISTISSWREKGQEGAPDNAVSE